MIPGMVQPTSARTPPAIGLGISALVFLLAEAAFILPGGPTPFTVCEGSSPLWFPAVLRQTLDFIHTIPCTGGPQQLLLAGQLYSIRIWVAVMLVLALLSGAVSYSSVWYVMEANRHGTPEARRVWRLKIALRCLLFGLALFVWLPHDPQWNLAGFGASIRIKSGSLPPIIAAAVATLALWVLEMPCREITAGRLELDLAEFQWIRQGIQKTLSMSSAILVFGVISIYVRRVVVLQFAGNYLAKRQILLEAFAYTCMLGLAYIPAHLAVNETAGRLRAAMLPPLQSWQAQAVLEYQKAADGLDEMLRIRLNDWKGFGPGFAILAPTLLSLMAGLAGKML